jgi:hypothetical protein
MGGHCVSWCKQTLDYSKLHSDVIVFAKNVTFYQVEVIFIAYYPYNLVVSFK